MIRTVAVVGGGTMGTGIAYVASLAGASVAVVEPDAGRSEALMRTVRRTAAKGVERGKLDERRSTALIERIRCMNDIETLPENLDLVIETVPERLGLKRRVLAAIALREPEIIATNTSSLSIDELAASVKVPERFLGMHFFNPVWSIRLVELVRGEATAEATLDAAREFASGLGKESLTVRDVPGFATSRLDLIASLEAMRMLESGVASAEDIDKAAVLAYRHPVGPLRLSDIVGLDVRLDIARSLERAHGPRFAPPKILADTVAQGHLGRKTGRGFFVWEQDRKKDAAHGR